FIPCSDGQSTRCPANEINAKQIWSALKQSVLNNFGDTGWVAVGLSLTAKTPAAYQDSYENFLQTSTLEIEALQD
ncbi:hypothetical protein PILCRDRAFT_817973, partial [Piloderma croceum F 1598]